MVLFNDAPSAAELLTAARQHSGLTKSAFAKAAGTSRSALDQYEQGRRVPRYDTLVRALRAGSTSVSIQLAPRPGIGDVSANSLSTFLARSDIDDAQWTWRLLVGDFVANEFVPSSRTRRRELLCTAPDPTNHPGWDSFAAALAEHLAFHANIAPPAWVFDEDRFRLRHFWWPVHGVLASMRAAALAHSPASFKRRLVLVDGREVPRVRR